MQKFDFAHIEKIFSEIKNISLKILFLLTDNKIEQEIKLAKLNLLFERRRILLEDLKIVYDSNFWHNIYEVKKDFINKYFLEIEEFDNEINKKLGNIVSSIGNKIKNLVKTSAVLKYNEGR